MRMSHSSWPCMSLQGQEELEEVNPPLMGCELGLAIERHGFFEFLLPGTKKSLTLEAILEMLFFFAGTTAEQNGGEPS